MLYKAFAPAFFLLSAVGAGCAFDEPMSSDEPSGTVDAGGDTNRPPDSGNTHPENTDPDNLHWENAVEVTPGPLDPNSIHFVATSADVTPLEGSVFEKPPVMNVAGHVRLEEKDDGALTIHLTPTWSMSTVAEPFLETDDQGVYEGEACFADVDGPNGSVFVEPQVTCVTRLRLSDDPLTYGSVITFEGNEYRTTKDLGTSSPISGTFVVAPDDRAPELFIYRYREPYVPFEGFWVAFSEPLSAGQVAETLVLSDDFVVDADSDPTLLALVRPKTWWTDGEDLVVAGALRDAAGNERAVDEARIAVMALPAPHTSRTEFDAVTDASVDSDGHSEIGNGRLGLDQCDYGDEEGSVFDIGYDALIGFAGAPSFSKITMRVFIESGFDTFDPEEGGDDPVGFVFGSVGFAEHGKPAIRVQGELIDIDDEGWRTYEYVLDQPVEEGYVHFQSERGMESEFCWYSATYVDWIEVE